MSIYEQYTNSVKEYEKVLDECPGIVSGQILCDDDYQTRLINSWMQLQQSSYDLECMNDDFDLDM